MLETRIDSIRNNKDYVRRMIVVRNHKFPCTVITCGEMAGRCISKQLLQFDRLPRQSDGTFYNLELQTGLGIDLNFIVDYR